MIEQGHNRSAVGDESDVLVGRDVDGGLPANHKQLEFWKRIRAVLSVLVVVAVFFAVWLVAFADNEAVPVLPDTTEQVSLDLRVAETLDHSIVYAVEQRARPMYRILAFDPASGTDETVFTVPEDAVIYGMTLAPDGERLAVSYAEDFHVDGNGIWILDLETLAFEELTSQESNVYLTELEWSVDGKQIYATHINQESDEEELSIATVLVETGAVEVLVNGAITPAASADGLFYLTVDDQKARRAIGFVGEAGTPSTISVLDGEKDLDHLIFDEAEQDVLLVAVLDDQEEEEVSIGAPAAAHGNHNIPSAWWSIDDVSFDAEPTDFEPIIVYDATVSDSGAIVYATPEGLSIAGDTRVDVIKSRAIRFVAA